MADKREVSEAGAKALIHQMYEAALAAAAPEAAVCRHLQRDSDHLLLNDRRWPVRGRVVVVGAGKAAVAMCRAVESVCGDLVDSGLVITKDGHRSEPLPAKIEVVEAAHPIPDSRGVDGTRRILDMLKDVREGDVVIALISGGGSALLEAPREGVSLEDMALVTDLLLRAGAPIHDLNAVRGPLSQVKGGGLLRASGRATVLSLMLSDVLGNDPTVIASGPTVPPDLSKNDPMSILEQYALFDHVPANVIDALKESSQRTWESEKSGPTDYVIVADNDTAIDAATEVARERGKRVSVPWRQIQGEASSLGRTWVETCRESGDEVDVVVGGGEATVNVRGEGLGGRNTEFALAAALALSNDADVPWVVASLATDGQDALTNAAGAIATSTTARDAKAAGIDPVNALRANDSLRVFEAAGGLVAPGPTGTNVNDIYIGVRLS